MGGDITQGQIISYTDMTALVGVSLQQGMNFRLPGGPVLLMSRRPNAPYDDQIQDDGRVLVYEGHDCPTTSSCPDPKKVDQPRNNPGGSLTQNGLFAEAAERHKTRGEPPVQVRVFEKIRPGIWAFNGVFDLVDSWFADSNGRKVFKFKLQSNHWNADLVASDPSLIEEDDRIIPGWVKFEVWKRDQGRCRKCGAESGLHFDHIIPYSKGGSSKSPENIQILCAKHNLAKHDKID
jgi:hypothetical protein